MSERNNEAGSIVIGEGVSASGKFIVPGRAVINGSLDGELQAEDLLVGAQGKIVGNVKVRRADVYGEVHDSLLASEHLIIRTSGWVNGNASYGEIRNRARWPRPRRSPACQGFGGCVCFC